jgi:hypothetical protein
MESTDDFPASYRVRNNDTDQLTGVPFSTDIPPLRNAALPPPQERWGKRQSELGM